MELLYIIGKFIKNNWDEAERILRERKKMKHIRINHCDIIKLEYAIEQMEYIEKQVSNSYISTCDNKEDLKKLEKLIGL